MVSFRAVRVVELRREIILRRMSRKENAVIELHADVTERVVFEAILYPHRSLGRRGYLILWAGTALIMGAYAITFLFIGAWPIFGFIGAEWLLFWYLFSRHFRGDRRAERLRLFADRLIVERIDAKGRLRSFSLQPYWLQVILARAADADNALYLRSHGKEMEIGSFLSEPERRDFASELTRALKRQRDGGYVDA